MAAVDGAAVPLLPAKQPLYVRSRGLYLGLLTGINLLNYLDRYTIAGVLPLLQDHTKSGFRCFALYYLCNENNED